MPQNVILRINKQGKMTVISLLIDGKELKKLEVSVNSSTSEVMNAFWSLLDVAEAERESHVLKLYRSDGVFIPIGPHIPSSNEPYSLRLKKGIYSCIDLIVCQVEGLHSPVDSLKFSKNVIEEIHDIKKNLLTVKSKIDVSLLY